MRIHLIGVGGAAMGNLAAMLKTLGHQVSGSDHELYPPMSDRLREWKIDARPFDERNLAKAELVIVGNAISRGNPEAEAMLNRGLPYLSMPAALQEFFLRDKQVITVAGTHGKTTTTFLIDHLLSSGKHGAPGLFVGGVRADGMDGFRVSKSPYFVIEGDEYDTSFFDMHPKFLHYRPRYLALTSLEYDHADIYENERMYRRSFERLLRLIPSEGLVVACASDKGVRETLQGYELAPVEYYASPRYAARLKSARTALQLAGGLYTYHRRGRTVNFDFPGPVDEFALIGEHNTGNALAAALIVRRLGLDEDTIAAGLSSFPGVLRRQQIRAEAPAGNGFGPALFMEDFAHHPTAVEATLAAVREAYPGRRVIALFEPRSATSHRKVFQRRYAKAFRKADEVWITDVFNANKVAPGERLDVRRLIREIAEQKKSRAHFCKDPADLLAKLAKSYKRSEQGDVILAMSNGAFGGIYSDLGQILTRA